MKEGTRKCRRTLSLMLAAAALVAGCGSDLEEGSAKERKQAAGQVLRLGVVTAPGKISFDKKRLEAKAGRVTIELRNDQELGHNVRIATGKKCCLRPDSEDVGGTDTIGKGKARAVVDLKPGNYVFYCSIGGHWQRGQRGSLVVRG